MADITILYLLRAHISDSNLKHTKGFLHQVLDQYLAL